MDDFVKQKLKNWDLERYVSIFEEQEIDEASFFCLTKELIKDLFQNKAGPQAKFLYQWQMWKNSFPSSDIKLSNNSNFQPVEFEFMKSNAGQTIYEEQEIDILVTARNDTENLESISEKTLNLDSLKENVSEVSFRTFLLKKTDGIVATKFYEDNECLTDSIRNNLCDCIIEAEILNSTDYKIETSRFLEIAEKIKQEFPNEERTTYYIPGYTNSVTGKRVFAKGKLFDKYNKYRLKLRKNNVIVKKGKQRVSISKAFILGFRNILRPKEANEAYRKSIEDKLQWLMGNLSPWETVTEYWKDTSLSRIEALFSSNTTSNCYITKYRVLGQPKASDLFQIDFNTVYPTKNLSLYSKFEILKQQIFKYAEFKIVEDNDPHCEKNTELKELLTLLNNHSEGNIEEVSNSTDIIAFRILPLLLPCRCLKVGRKPTWRPSKPEVQDGFFLHIKNYTEMSNALSKRIEKLNEHGLTAQPLPVAVGSSLLDISAYYIIINGNEYKVESAKTAVDIAFKSFYALQIEYPQEAELIWIFLQKNIYEINGENDKIVPSVESLINDLGR